MAKMKKDDPSRAFPDKLIRHLDEAHDICGVSP
jgi:hypothetical protein